VCYRAVVYVEAFQVSSSVASKAQCSPSVDFGVDEG
jgi:hypothetical protein